MLSFHNDPAIKEYYVARVEAHMAADELIHGEYWEDGKGCAVGCTIHGNSHAAYETELGLPEWLAWLEDALFEGQTNGDAKEFVARFLPSIPVGVALEPVKWKFCVFVLKENLERVLALDLSESLQTEVVSAIRGVLAVHEHAANGGGWDESAAWSAWSAAESAAKSAAESAAESAAKSAAWSAKSAAWSAAWSAAESAAESAAYKRYADEILRLLREAR